MRAAADPSRPHRAPPLFGLAIAALTPVLLLTAGCGDKASPPEPVRAVRTIVVETGGGESHTEFAAEIKPRVESRLGFRVAGRLQVRLAEVGQRVHPGEVLARLDPQDLRLSHDAATAAMRAASANHDGAQADLRRYRELKDQGFISAAELERREIAARVARAQWEQAHAGAEMQGHQAVYATLTAPASAVVTGVDAEPGMVLAAGTPVVRIAWDGPRDAVFAVPEGTVAPWRARIGQPGLVTVQVGQGQARTAATVREVAASADPLTRTYLVKADLGMPEVALGQTARVRVAQPASSAGLRLPLSSVVERGGQSMVWVVEGNPMVARGRRVALAGTVSDQVVVSAGLQQGERVVVAGVHVLNEGQAVKLWQPGSATTAGAAPARDGSAAR